MAEIIHTDICIIGGGSGGLTVAAGAAQMGAKTVLFERGKMGGDCLNTGCVPSKALLAAGKVAKAATGNPEMGIHPHADPEIDFAVVGPDCKVIGTETLFCADSSLFPRITNGNLNAPSIMTGEKAADHILGQTRLPSVNNNPFVHPHWQTQQR